MVVIPLIISAIVIGIVSVGDNKMLAKFGKKMVFYYTIISIAAVSIGATLALVFKPGLTAKAFIDANIASNLQEVVKATMQSNMADFWNVILGLIPKNPFAALANGELIPIIIFLLIFSVALAKVGDMNRPVVSFFESIFAATMKVTDWIMFLAAPGVFALMASAVSDFGLSMFAGVWKYILVILFYFGITNL
jgi:proton glutamate symport protein